MLTIAVKFSKEMGEAIAFVDLLEAALLLGNKNPKRLRSKHPISIQGLIVHNKVNALSTALVGYDGTFLTICAQFEMTMRSLIERFVEQAVAKKANFNHLPLSMRQWHSKGCAYLLANIDRDQFKHLTEASIVNNLYNCLYSSTNPYQLTVEAFSYNERNLKSQIIGDLVSSRLGMKDMWKHIASNAKIMSFFGSSTIPTTQQLVTNKLNTAMERRNAIIHRGKHYYTASNSEVQDTAKFYSILIDCFAEFLNNQLVKL